MTTATEIQAQIEAEKQAHARRLVELEQKMLEAEHAELTELITHHAENLPDSAARALKWAQIEHHMIRLEADNLAMEEALEQVPMFRRFEAHLAGKRF